MSEDKDNTWKNDGDRSDNDESVEELDEDRYTANEKQQIQDFRNTLDKSIFRIGNHVLFYTTHMKAQHDFRAAWFEWAADLTLLVLTFWDLLDGRNGSKTVENLEVVTFFFKIILLQFWYGYSQYHAAGRVCNSNNNEQQQSDAARGDNDDADEEKGINKMPSEVYDNHGGFGLSPSFEAFRDHMALLYHYNKTANENEAFSKISQALFYMSALVLIPMFLMDVIFTYASWLLPFLCCGGGGEVCIFWILACLQIKDSDKGDRIASMFGALMGSLLWALFSKGLFFPDWQGPGRTIVAYLALQVQDKFYTALLFKKQPHQYVKSLMLFDLIGQIADIIADEVLDVGEIGDGNANAQQQQCQQEQQEEEKEEEPDPQDFVGAAGEAADFADAEEHKKTSSNDKDKNKKNNTYSENDGSDQQEQHSSA